MSLAQTFPDKTRRPTRLRNFDEAQARFGPLADKLALALMRTDPLADEVVASFVALGPGAGRAMLERALAQGVQAVPDAPESLRALFARIDGVPDWVDLERCDLGARVYRRVSFGSALTLSAYSLMSGYHSAAAIKPLAFTGGLSERAPRRIAETGRYVVETSRHGGLRRQGEGLKVAVRVRVMHAQVRRMIRASGRWQDSVWGAPINQADMAITGLEFSSMVLRGCRALGYRFSRDESEAVMHLFRYAAYLMGVDDDLLSVMDDEAIANSYEALVRFTIDGPDEDSLVLADALRRAFVTGAGTPLAALQALSLRPLHDGLVWKLCGAKVASELGMQRPWLERLVPLAATGISAIEALRVRSPALEQTLTEYGARALEEQIARALQGAEPRFDASKPGTNGSSWWQSAANRLVSSFA